MNAHATNVTPAEAEVAPESRDIMGVDVLSMDRQNAVALFGRWLVRRQTAKIAFLNAHASNLADADTELHEMLRRFVVLPDGMGVDIASNVLHGSPFPDNLNGTDFVPYLLQALPGPLTVGLLGASRDNVEAACDRFARMVPRHRFVIVGDGFFDPEAEPKVLHKLAVLRPDILLVAMGVPRQEYFVDRLGPEHATLAFAVGALFDFVSGAIPRAPMWMRKARLEWLFRLMLEPQRLWQRYIIGNPLFLWRLAKYRFLRRNGA